jgi:ubiquinone/menaquinone biosynthesis C-methylase UbiE
MKPQVKKEHYFNRKYNDLARFISYFYQTDLAMESAGGDDRKILEVGMGSGIFSAYMKKLGREVITCDFDAALNPDVVADIRKLPFSANEFVIATAFEVLEHIPFADVPSALDELRRVADRAVVISLPYRSTYFEFVLRVPFMRTLFKKDFFSWLIRIPLRFKGIAYSGQHYWEIDGRNYPLKRVMRLLEERFTSVRKIRPVLDGYRLFFVLKK